MKIINNTLKNPSYDIGGFSYSEMRAKSLNATIGAKIVSDEDRKFSYAMESRNISNMVDIKTVDALHAAVADYGAVQAKRYYKIVAQLLDKKVLKWSDRNAKMPFANMEKINWNNGLNMVRDAYQNFSPTMGKLFDEIVTDNHIDVGVYSGKTTGAFSCSFVAPKNTAGTFVFMNYQNSVRDVMVLAHEMGHSIHGLLAGREQGVLMSDAPMAYAETASIFGEMITFENLLSHVKSDKEKLVLLLEKCSDWMNSVVRQISFSMFEQKIHTARLNGKISVADFNKFWLDTTRDFYGDDGDIFDYSDIDSLWSYVGHFMRPFYVYAYAFGELFTQSLFAVRNNFSTETFEKLYLDMLKSGNTKDAVALMQPFNLNPNDANFWKNGIDCSVKKWLDEIEILIEKLDM
jgi:oligoendopeptidase F